MSFLDVLGQLVDAFLSLVPRPTTVRATHKAVKFKWGRAVIVDSGWRWWWPLTTEMDEHPVVSQPLELPAQSVMTRDGQSVVVSGVALYHVTDLRSYAVDNYDSDEAMAEVAGSAIRDVVVSKTLQELQEPDGRKAANKTLVAQARQELSRYGVEIEYFKLTDLSVCRVINLVGGSTQAVIED